jgi:hypothetical protein
VKRARHHLIAVLICVLAIGVFTLASAAKCSQYQLGPHSEGYLAKATKMSGERCQTAAAMVPVIVPQFRPADPEPRLLAELPDPVLPTAVFLDSFHFRPPPARVA